ncbi:substrate-binding domain-containing protein, partial [Cronobacter sakazakii]
MHKRMTTWIAALTLSSLSSVALAQEITVMISGGFKAALEQLRPVYETQSGTQIVIVPGPSMGKTPQAIPNRLARGEKADVVIMVGDAL